LNRDISSRINYKEVVPKVYSSMTQGIKKKFMPVRWDNKEKEILLALFEEGKSFEEIAKEVNKFLETKKNEYEFTNVRTPISVAFQCRQLKLITQERLNSYIKRFKNKLKKDRARDIYKVKKNVFERDGNKCVICDSNQKIQFCHLMPFRDVRKNKEMESVTLCVIHHKEFDKNSEFIVRKVFKKMCLYYPDYSCKYELSVSCGIQRKWS
jgi:hypothetical protein